jgi:CBS domain-containing protein
MTPLEKLHTVSASDPAIQVLQTMAQFDVNQLPIVDRGLLVGMVSRGDILRLIQVRREVAIEA